MRAKLVNEAIRHLSPKSREEIRDSIFKLPENSQYRQMIKHASHFSDEEINNAKNQNDIFRARTKNGPPRKLSKKELQQFEDLSDPDNEDNEDILTALQFPEMPSIDIVALKVKNALKRAFKNADPDDEYEYRNVALNALNFNPLVKNFKNIVAWIGDNEGYVDPNTEHPGYFKGIKLFCEDRDIDEDDVIEYFLDTATYRHGLYVEDNIYEL